MEACYLELSRGNLLGEGLLMNGRFLPASTLDSLFPLDILPMHKEGSHLWRQVCSAPSLEVFRVALLLIVAIYISASPAV